MMLGGKSPRKASESRNSRNSSKKEESENGREQKRSENSRGNSNHMSNVKKEGSSHSTSDSKAHEEHQKKGTAHNSGYTKSEKNKKGNANEDGSPLSMKEKNTSNSSPRVAAGGGEVKGTSKDEANSGKKNTVKWEDERNDNLKRGHKRTMDANDEMKEQSANCKKQKCENSTTVECELSLYDEFRNSIQGNDKNFVQSYVKKIKSNFFSYWNECEYQLKELRKRYLENEKLIKEIVQENNLLMSNVDDAADNLTETVAGEEGESGQQTEKNPPSVEHSTENYSPVEKTKMEKKRQILNNILNIKMIYRMIEMYLFTMRQFSFLLKENNNFISLIVDEENVEKKNYERIIGNFLNFEAKNYEKIKKSALKNKMPSVNNFFKNSPQGNNYPKDEMTHFYTLKCLEEEISDRTKAKENLRLLMMKKKECTEEYQKHDQRKATSFNKLSLFTSSIKSFIDKYYTLDFPQTKYLSSVYFKMMHGQMEMNSSNVSLLNNKRPFNFLFSVKEQGGGNSVSNSGGNSGGALHDGYNHVYTYMKYDVITQTRKNPKNSEPSPQEDIHDESVTINMYTKDNFDISILPDLTYLKYLQIQIEIFYLLKRDCLVAKTTPVQFLGLNGGRSLLSDIYSNEDHFVFFSEGVDSFYNFKYGFPFFWLNAMGGKPCGSSSGSGSGSGSGGGSGSGNNGGSAANGANGANGQNGVIGGSAPRERPANEQLDKNKLSEIYQWHLGRTLDVSVFFSKIFTRALFRIWDVWQVNHYKYYPNVFPPFSHEKHLEALKKIQSSSLQQVSYFDIITEEAYLKEEKENTEERSNDNLYACCFIQLYEPYVIKSYISVPFNGKEPYFSVFLTKKKTQKRLKKLQDYLNTTVVNKHSKVEDTQRQIILTLQLAKLREGAHKYYKSFSKSSTPIFDEEIS
ncbi:unnamed protein product [Plasmodium vivax]|uniref:Uncharacterized protein n=3 Tax=Plasmodium vivax TaxID=5855 RepID=A5K4N5_PLAVS|nr:hypothetical protein, conserved [Plasmodium vivax]EDL45613.1 hypothetical protein, conserved [Plasmodium vivax]KMZ80469.1 hypothetical protein PVIIG_03721 [Plasmodium vivax India VII]CAG9476876.1 unnamed protein product [Plasmodium vivax]|eukprot:XP_001615340.1 hypothetical protein [Plasmodium vivax Sal-1]